MSSYDLLSIYNTTERKFFVSMISSKKYVPFFMFISLTSPIYTILTIFGLMSLVISKTILFITIHVFVVSEVSTNSNVNSTEY